MPQLVIDRTANGWGPASGGIYGPVSRTLSEASYSVVYTDDTFPIIYSTGYVAVAAIPATLSRVVRVATTNTPLFTAPMAAKFDIDLKGNKIVTDSFNPLDPNLSTDGRYDPLKTSTNGTIASMEGVVNVGNADVHGDVLLGPTASDSISKNGLITGDVYHDFNYDFWDVTLPDAQWFPVTAGDTTIDGITYQYAFFNDEDCVVSGLNGDIYVGTNAQVRLKLTGNATAGLIRVAGVTNSAGSLTIYMTGQSFSLGGQSTVDCHNARNLSYYGTTNNTSITFGGNASFTGTIYAPQANFTLGGGGANTYDFVGACVVNSVTMNGHFNFHFPEDLLTQGPVKGYIAWSWREL